MLLNFYFLFSVLRRVSVFFLIFFASWCWINWLIYLSTCQILHPALRWTYKFVRLRNDLYCVEWGVKLYSLTHLQIWTHRFSDILLLFFVLLSFNQSLLQNMHTSPRRHVKVAWTNVAENCNAEVAEFYLYRVVDKIRLPLHGSSLPRSFMPPWHAVEGLCACFEAGTDWNSIRSAAVRFRRGRRWVAYLLCICWIGNFAMLLI